MRNGRTWMSLVLCGSAWTAVQCDPQPSGELAVLPMHELDFSNPSAGAGARAHAAGRRAERSGSRHQWAAGGNRPWRHIVIHHSATDRGSATMFDRSHRARGWDELGYHFVIDNGSGGPDGRVEVGSRWRAQKWGAHCGGTPNNAYNNYGIGICLVGNFDRGMPTRRQLDSLGRLVGYLAAEHDIPPERVIGHRDAPNAATRCPGEKLHEYISRTLRPELARRLAMGK